MAAGTRPLNTPLAKHLSLSLYVAYFLPSFSHLYSSTILAYQLKILFFLLCKLQLYF